MVLLHYLQWLDSGVTAVAWVVQEETPAKTTANTCHLGFFDNAQKAFRSLSPFLRPSEQALTLQPCLLARDLTDTQKKTLCLPAANKEQTASASRWYPWKRLLVGQKALRLAYGTPKGQHCSHILPHAVTLFEMHTHSGFSCLQSRLKQGQPVSPTPVLFPPPNLKQGQTHSPTAQLPGPASAGPCFAAEATNRTTRAESQQIVTTRLLYCLQYPVVHLSRMHRIYPRAS